MRCPTLPSGWPLWAAGWCILLAVSLSAQDEISMVGRKEAGGPPIFPPGSGDGFSEAPLCPHRNKSATLVPSFTKTTTTVPHHTTTHHHITNHTTPRHNMTTQPQKHTTTHHPHHTSTTTTHHHTKTHHPHTTTSMPHPTHRPHNHTTTHHAHTTTSVPHPTPRPHNHTTTHHPHTTTSVPHPTPRPHNHTTTHHAHTTTSMPHPTPRPHNHTTTHHPHTTTSVPDPTPRPHNHTTTHHPHTTTSVPHPTPPPHNHTTAPATSQPHTKTPPPTLVPFISVGNYVVRNGSVVCLRAQTGLQLQVRYTDRAKQQLWGEFAVQPNRTLVHGTCSDKTAILELNFPEGFIFFTFQKNETQNKFYLSRIQANLTYQFPRATETSFTADNASLHEFEARLGHSYQCQNRTLALADGFRLNAQNERVQAFELKDGQFGEADVCPRPRRSSIVPIIVGVLLALLILIVIIAFLVGRRRAHSGYQTL